MRIRRLLIRSILPSRLAPEFFALLKQRLTRIVEIPEGGRETTCGGCWRATLESKGQKMPKCHVGPCEVSEVMLLEVELFVSMFFLLKSDVFKRQPLDLLDRAGARLEDYDVFAVMESTLGELQERKRARARRA